MSDVFDFVVSRESLIGALRAAGAKERYLEWLSSGRRTIGEAISKHPRLVLWAVHHGILPKELAEHVDSIIRVVAEREPGVALRYVADRLSPDLLDWCAWYAPCVALQYAAPLLQPERLEWCAKREPYEALQYAAELLSPETLDWCARHALYPALQYAANQLSRERLEWCARQEPSFALQYAAELLPQSLVEELEEAKRERERLEWCHQSG